MTSSMIPIDEALRIVLANLPPRRVERLALKAALGRVLAEDVVADMDVPPFRRSAVDGFAVRSADLSATPAHLRLVGESRAGQASAAAVGPGEAIAIMTGAPVPDGADAVQMVEACSRANAGEIVVSKAV